MCLKQTLQNNFVSNMKTHNNYVVCINTFLILGYNIFILLLIVIILISHCSKNNVIYRHMLSTEDCWTTNCYVSTKINSV